ncbi:MAG: ParA family protein [Anaerolineae bacterium]
MNVITVFNEKGGVGKTTLTGLIGAGLAMRGHRVLLIDADGQGDLTRNMNLPKSAGFFRFVKWGNPNEPDYVQTSQIVQRVPGDVCPENLYIVSGNNDTWGIPGSTTLAQIGTNMIARLRGLKNVFDYVLIDTQPSATTLHDGIGLITDHFICPTDPEALSAFGGLQSTIQHIDYIREQAGSRGHNKANLLGIIPNKYRMNTNLHEHVYEKLIEMYGAKVWDPMPLRTAIPEAQYMAATLMLDAPDLNTNDFIWQIVDRVRAEVPA